MSTWVGVGFLPVGDSAWIGVLLLLVVNSFGEGFFFLASFKTSMQMSETGGGVALGLVSMCMSLSLSVATGSINAYSSFCPKSENSCWRAYVKMFAVQASIAYIIGFIALLFFKVKNYPWLLQEGAKESEKKPLINGAEDGSNEQESLIDDESKALSKPMTETGPDDKVSALRTFKIWLHPYFLVMFFAYFGAMGSSVSVLSTIEPLWVNYINGTLCTGVDVKSCQYYGGIEIVGQSFSYSSAAAGVFSAVLTHFLVRKKLIRARRLYQMIIVLQMVCYVIIGTLYVVSTRTFGSLFAFAFFLSLLGFTFGCSLNFAAISFGDLFGYANFGTYYSFMQLSGSAAAATGALIAQGLFEKFQSYTVYLFGWLVVLAISLLLLAVVPITEFKR